LINGRSLWGVHFANPLRCVTSIGLTQALGLAGWGGVKFSFPACIPGDQERAAGHWPRFVCEQRKFIYVYSNLNRWLHSIMSLQ
jgi:hypothetical protein